MKDHAIVLTQTNINSMDQFSDGADECETTPPFAHKDRNDSPPPKLSIDSSLEELQDQSEGEEERLAWEEHDLSCNTRICSKYKKQRGLPTITLLEDGTVHVCGGAIFCSDAEPNKDRLFVCPHSGLVFDNECAAEFYDLNGGSERRSGDPDQVGAEVRCKGGSKRTDAANASRNAFVRSQDLDDTVDPSTYIAPLSSLISSRKKKRGALCVGETEGEEMVSLGHSRHRGCATTSVHRPLPVTHAKKNSACLRGARDGREADAPLYREAVMVMDVLTNPRIRCQDRYSASAKDGGAGRLESGHATGTKRDESFASQFEEYIRKQRMGGKVVTFDEAHNFCLQYRRDHQDSEATQKDLQVSKHHLAVMRTVRYRNALIALCISVWKACCRTPYLRRSRGGGTGAAGVASSSGCSFRPLMTGVIYAMRRGMTLPSGTPLLPACGTIDTVLPALRSTATSTVLHALHSSSHRGIGILSRCIASVPLEQQEEAFQHAVRSCRSFQQSRFSSADV